MTPLTHEQRQELIHRSFPIRVAYTGKIWGGVQVIDKFMRPDDDGQGCPTQGIYEGLGYTGIYADAGELAEMEVLALLGEDN